MARAHCAGRAGEILKGAHELVAIHTFVSPEDVLVSDVGNGTVLFRSW